ncbi:MAG TPA: DUF1905 domain-containing protein [Ilumatobacteraceae bacterium]|nr:DUF1905 domain-containing protein [Ilumatobacteraceae bacterium]
MAGEYMVTGEVELFPQEGGWFFVRVPRWISDELDDMADRGLIAIRATIGDSTWDTSLLPMGDGTKFIALNARVRKVNVLALGDHLTVRFSLRDR